MSEIPEAAIEAAADIIRMVDYPHYEADLHLAQRVLEAALPHLIREAVADALEAAAEAKYDGLYGESLHAWLYARAAAVRAGEA